jgi:hypothetical protein
MELINALVLIAGGLLATSALIVAKKPDAKQLIDKLVPYQAIIGVVMLAFGILNLLRWLGPALKIISHMPLFGLTMLSLCVVSILLGFIFGMPQIAKWMPGNAAAEQKGNALMAKLAPYQTVLGLIGLATGVLVLLYQFHILGTMW